MQFFKLLALVPMAASLVAASSAQPAHIAALAARNEMMTKPNCDTSSISQVAAHLDLNVEVSAQAALAVYRNYSDSVSQTVANVTADVRAHASTEANVQAEVLVQAIVNLKAVLDVSVNVLLQINSHLKKQGCDYGDLDPSAQTDLVAVFAQIQLALEASVQAWAQLKATASIKAELELSINLFIGVYRSFADQCSDSIIGLGLNAEIRASVEATLNLLLRLNINLGLDASALLHIGA